MKHTVTALFLLAALVCCIEEVQPISTQVPNFPPNNYDQLDPQFARPPTLGSPYPEPNLPNRPPAQCPNHLRLQTSEYILSFDWAPRTLGISIQNLETSQGFIKLGSDIIARLSPENGYSGIKHEELNLNLENGEYALIFEGTGKADDIGISLTNVVMKCRNSNRNLITNGEFLLPRVDGVLKKYQTGIPGWTTDLAKIGPCRFFNHNWRSGQCIELDAGRNLFYFQRFIVGTC